MKRSEFDERMRWLVDDHERLIRDAADAMVASGMRDAGDGYVNIDDWRRACGG